MITVFTPTYNRCETLKRLYKSLLNQNCKDFCWLIVDDGSADDTQKLVSKWIAENKISIRYYRQENQGKPAAHNKGVELTETELFTCVDSDDYLVSNAIEKISETWRKTQKENIVGILAFKGYSETKAVTNIKNNINKGNLRFLYDNGLSGDTMLVFKTDIIKKYSFPKFENEKFIPEAYLYDLIDQEGSLFVLKEILYICEYLPGGYSANMAKLLYNNPQGYFCYINQRLKFDENFRQRFFDSIRYTAMAIAHKKEKFVKNSVYPFISFLSLPFGYILYLIKYKKFR